MKLLRFAAIALLATITMVACDDDDGVAPPAPPVVIVGTVSGTVSVEGTGLAGVTVNLVGAASQSATTGAGGTYSFSNVPGGTYGVQVSGGPADVTFATTSTVVTISTSGQTVTADFGGNYIRTSSIRGSITAGSTGIVATVNLAGTGMLAGEDRAGSSDTNGDFEFTGLRSGDYTVTISDFGTADITVTSRDVSVAVGQSANVTFVGTVEEVTTAATVTISTITVSGTAGVTVIPTAVVGSIDVNLIINEGTSSLTSASVLLDGVIVGTQTFSTGAPAEDGAESAERNATVQIGTAFCGAIPGTPCAAGNGTPTHSSGNHVISAVVNTSDGASATAANSVNLTFANPDVLLGALTAAGGTAVSAASQLWYGGALTVTLTPVLYSGLTLGTVTTTYTDNNAAHGGPLTATAAPWAVTFPSAAGTSTLLGHSSNPAVPDVLTVTGAAYTNGTAFALGGTGIAPAAPPFAFIGGVPANAAVGGAPILTDLIAPIVTGVFTLTDQAVAGATVVCCANNWINSAYPFANGLTTTGDTGGPGAFAGVGISATTFHIGAATSTAATVQATASAATAGAAGIATSLLNTDNQLWVGLTDLLGNRSNTSLAGAGSNGLTTVGVEDNLPTAVTAAASPATITNQTIIPAAAAGGAAHLSGFSLGGVEDRAGFSAFPVQAWMTQVPGTTNPTGTFILGASPTAGGVVNAIATMLPCGAGGAPGLLAAMNAAPCVPEFPGAPDAYYKMGGALMDQAGNIVAEITRDWLIDQTVPTTSNVAIPPSLTGGAPATFSAAVTDNIDLWTTAFAFDFGGFGSFIPFTDPVQLEAAPAARFDGAPTLTQSAVQTVNLIAQTEITTAGFAPPGAGSSVLATNVTATTFDAAGNSSVGANNFIAGTVVAVTEYVAQAAPLTTFQVLAPAAAVTLCNGTGAAACAVGNVKTVTLNAEATGPTGTMPNSFASGTIYYFLVTDDGDGVPYTTGPEVWTLLGSTSGSSATFTDDGVGGLRHYNHNFVLNGTHPAIAALGAGPAATTIAAIGVNSAGAALITRFNANITVVAGT